MSSVLDIENGPSETISCPEQYISSEASLLVFMEFIVIYNNITACLRQCMITSGSMVGSLGMMSEFCATVFNKVFHQGWGLI